MIQEQIQKDIIIAMKAKDEHTLSTLRMAKSALQNKEKVRQEPLTDAEVEVVLASLIKQRKDSFDQFRRGNRLDLAFKEEAEIRMLEKYLPQEATESQIHFAAQIMQSTLLSTGSTVQDPKLLGAVIKGTKENLALAGLRVDGKLLSTVAKKIIDNKKAYTEDSKEREGV